jgi:hypothetical protein
MKLTKHESAHPRPRSKNCEAQKRVGRKGAPTVRKRTPLIVSERRSAESVDLDAFARAVLAMVRAQQPQQRRAA